MKNESHKLQMNRLYLKYLKLIAEAKRQGKIIPMELVDAAYQCGINAGIDYEELQSLYVAPLNN